MADHCCSTHANSTGQTFDEMDWERGIWAAALNNDDQRLRLLLRAGSGVNELDVSGYSALHYASRAGHLTMCHILISEFGAKVNAQTRSGLATPLHRAAFTGRTEVVLYLLECGADPQLLDDAGKNSLHKGAEGGHECICRALMQHSPSLLSCADKHDKLPWQCLAEDVPPALRRDMKR